MARLSDERRRSYNHEDAVRKYRRAGQQVHTNERAARLSEESLRDAQRNARDDGDDLGRSGYAAGSGAGRGGFAATGENYRRRYGTGDPDAMSLVARAGAIAVLAIVLVATFALRGGTFGELATAREELSAAQSELSELEEANEELSEAIERHEAAVEQYG